MNADTETFYSGSVDDNLPPIDRMENKKHHEWVLEQLLTRIRSSEKSMSEFYPRWRIQERKVQAYMNLPRYEQILKDMNDSGKPPQPAIIVFPYQYATVSTIVTYLSQVFCSRKPIFQLGVSSSGSAEAVQLMETVLQYQADQQKLIMRMHQFFTDGEIYGLAILRNTWTERKSMRSVWSRPTAAEKALGMTGGRTRQEKTIYAGASIDNIDPFMFLPDPNVPMVEVGTKGEFVFWVEFPGKHILQEEERAGRLKYVDRADPFRPGRDATAFSFSNRALLSGGESHAGQKRNANTGGTYDNVSMLHQGSVVIIPDDWGLGPETHPVRYIFSILNKSQIVQAEPIDTDADCHPIIVSEPYTMGYSFGSPAITDYLSPVQDIMSWFIDSHIQNVRAVLNDTLIYDPSKIEGADLRRTGPGRLIRLKATAIGTDIRTAIQQLPINDVTKAHMSDLQMFMRIGDTVSAINDNARGQPQSGGRKSATEVRMGGEAAAGRLAAHAKLISSQAITELARQMTLNTQQFMEEAIYLKLVGGEKFAQIGPQMLQGDFVFPTHDGTLPIDRIAALEQWKEIFMAVQNDQELRQNYSLPRIFEFMASDLGGAVNIQSFRTNIMANPAEAPGMVPMNQLPSASDVISSGNPALGVPASGVVQMARPRFTPRTMATGQAAA